MQGRSGYRFATIMGLMSLVGWSTINAFTRGLSEPIGPFWLVGISATSAGVLLMARDWCRGVSPVNVARLPRRYLLLAGGLFVTYCLCFTAGLSLAPNRAAAVQLGLVNYLWPALTILFSIPILKTRARWWALILGCVLGFSGAVAATMEDSIQDFFEALSDNVLPFTLLLVAAVSWALYTNLTKALKSSHAPSGLGLFQLTTGLLALLVALATHERLSVSGDTLWQLAYFTLVPITLGYALWDYGAAHGNVHLMATAAYLLPLTNTLFACWWLEVPVSLGMLVGSALVICGAVLSQFGIRRNDTTGGGMLSGDRRDSLNESTPCDEVALS